MGASSSSLHQTDNDFELVVRVAKELDKTLKDDFGANDRQLGEKIDFVYQQGDLSTMTIHRMRHLVKLRNALVHDYDCSSLGELGTRRDQFRLMFEEVKDELEEVKAEKDRQRYSLVSSSTSRNGAQMQQNVSGWAMLGALAVAGVAAVAVASANDESSEQRRADRRRRDSSSRSYY